MIYNNFGDLSDRVSRFGMGCMRLPQTKNEQGQDIIDEQESIKMIRYAIDKGVNYFDTAYSYPGSEVLLGKALKDGFREKVTIATKCPVWDAKDHSDYLRLFEEELDRLQAGCIDVYIFHCLDRTNWEKVKSANGIEFMQNLKKSGRIRAMGFSFHGEADLFKEIIDTCSWDMCLIQLNILDQNHQAGLKGLGYASQKGIPVVIMEPLKGGLLGKKPPEEAEHLLKGYHEQRTLAEWAFRWLYNLKGVKVILSGVSSMEQLEDNLRIFSEAETGVLSPSDQQLIQQVKAVYEKKVKVGCTGCGYCMPCPAGVNIPEIFKVYNDSGLSDWTEFGKTFYGLVASHNGRDASNCIECRTCERHCPQKLQIVDLLKEAHEAMKSE